ncbi:hypothetical protein T459_17938 [Capsicum annuum]|uniref:Uncharacterized protein n=1 Tax=Capsicum annuum TaxID=4072 RepID=A0A2G2ZD10_CAPAN|nr:hypothetical protein T459_17938 [Capsicum annuum]
MWKDFLRRLNVGRLSRYTHNLNNEHWSTLMRLVKYLKGTMNYDILYSRFPSTLEGYCDANWIFDSDETKFTSGYMFTLGGGAVSWRSAKQTIIARSTMKSEFVALKLAGVVRIKFERFRWGEPTDLEVCLRGSTSSSSKREKFNSLSIRASKERFGLGFLKGVSIPDFPKVPQTVRKVKAPNPGEGDQMIVLVLVPFTGDVVVCTFAGEGAITLESPKRGILADVGTLNKRVLDDVIYQDRARRVGIEALDDGVNGRGTRDLPISPGIHFRTIFNGPMESIPAQLLGSDNIIPGSGSLAIVCLPVTMFSNENASPEGFLVGVESPAKSAKQSFIFNGSSMHIKTPIFLGLGNGVPIDVVHLFLNINCAPDVVSLGSIDQLMDGVPGKDDLGFCKINPLARVGVKVLDDSVDGVAVLVISSGKKGGFPPFTKTELEEEEIQERMSLMRPSGKLKKKKVCLIKDHSCLSKAFSRFEREDNSLDLLRRGDGLEHIMIGRVDRAPSRGVELGFNVFQGIVSGIQSRGMEEPSIRVSKEDPKNPGFKLPEFRLQTQDVVKLF